MKQSQEYLYNIQNIIDEKELYNTHRNKMCLHPIQDSSRDTCSKTEAPRIVWIWIMSITVNIVIIQFAWDSIGKLLRYGVNGPNSSWNSFKNYRRHNFQALILHSIQSERIQPQSQFEAVGFCSSVPWIGRGRLRLWCPNQGGLKMKIRRSPIAC